MRFRVLGCLLAAGLLSACAVDRSIGLAPGVQVTALEELPAPRGEISYAIGPQEKLAIDVVGAPSLSGTFLTDIDGNLAFPLIGKVDLAGKSPSEASELIADRLRGRFVLEPQVRVIPEEFPVPSISVGGQVKKPGSYPAVGRQTLLRAVNQAEGMTDFARVDDVLVFRTVNGQRYIGAYNMAAIERGNYADPVLYPNDIVVVGDSPERRRLETFLKLLPGFTTAAVLLITQS
jgi:polysaccharide export outer membrane protein